MTKGAPSSWWGMRSQKEEKSLLLINDDVNTFDHVIASLIDICGHDGIQAEQCAVLTHHKGGCIIKHGDAVTLEKMSLRLREENLDTVII